MIGRNLEPKRASKILAKTMYKQLIRMGFKEEDVIDFSREIIENLSTDYKIKNSVDNVKIAVSK